MRVTIAHSKTKAEAMQAVDRAMGDLFQNVAIPPLRISNPQKTWNGSVMTFSLMAQMGPLRNPISGSAEVTNENIIIEADLGLLERFLPAEKAGTLLRSKIRGLLT